MTAEEDEIFWVLLQMPNQNFNHWLSLKMLRQLSQEQFNAFHLVVTFSKNTVVQWHWCGIEVEFHHSDSYISVVGEVIPADFVKHFGILTDERCYTNGRYCYTPLRRKVSLYSSGFTVEHLEIMIIADNNSENSILNAADCRSFCILLVCNRRSHTDKQEEIFDNAIMENWLFFILYGQSATVRVIYMAASFTAQDY